MTAPVRYDYLIVGQGLAGSLVARLLLDRGKRVCVIDKGDPSAASRVAAGLINPVTGRKFVVTWRAETLLPFARDFYRRWETSLSEPVYFEKHIWRLFRNADEELLWQSKAGEAALAEYVEPLPRAWENVPGLLRQRGGFAIGGGAYVDTRKLLRLFRAELAERGALVEEGFSFDELNVYPEGVSWKDRTADRILFCEGHAASRNPYFSWLPFRHAKGELLTISGPALPEDVILNRGKWLLPVGDGYYRAGATYEWKDLSVEPTESGRQAILEGLGGVLAEGDLDVVAHEAGVRPIVRDTRPVAGVHPAHPAVVIFNGLGSKGVLWGPYFADQLVRHLEEGRPLDPEVDVRRNL